MTMSFKDTGASTATAPQAKAEPFQYKYVLDVVGATAKAEVPADVLYTIRLAAPPATLVAVVAVVALPVKAAVIVVAAKLPEESRATTLEAVFAEVASTVAVTAAEPLKLVPVRYVPNVRALATEPA